METSRPLSPEPPSSSLTDLVCDGSVCAGGACDGKTDWRGAGGGGGAPEGKTDPRGIGGGAFDGNTDPG